MLVRPPALFPLDFLCSASCSSTINSTRAANLKKLVCQITIYLLTFFLSFGGRVSNNDSLAYLLVYLRGGLQITILLSYLLTYLLGGRASNNDMLENLITY